jgi:mRNA-degrading endonuclease toxin of MazEF toxin-antitoxin module
MIKYFLTLLDWCKLQLTLAGTEQNKGRLFKERDVWWCSVGLNIGEEEFGKGPKFRRPVLILKKFTRSSFFGIPFTGSEKTGSWYIPVDLVGGRSSLMLNQGRIFDARRLGKKMTVINSEQFKEIKERFIEFHCP